MTTYEYIRQNEKELKGHKLLSNRICYQYEWYKKYLAFRLAGNKKNIAKRMTIECGISGWQLRRAIDFMEKIYEKEL